MQGENKGFQVCKRKMVSSAEQLCKFHPEPFQKFTEFVLNMKFDEEPKYAPCIALFQPLIDGPAERPIQIDPATFKVRWPAAHPVTVRRPRWRLAQAIPVESEAH